MSNKNSIKIPSLVICINPVYITYSTKSKELSDQYKVGNKYYAIEQYEKVPIADNDYLEFYWMVYCNDNNHYQFSDEEFKLYFADIHKIRDNKINNILK